MLGLIYGVLPWADMNAATALGVLGRSVMSLAGASARVDGRGNKGVALGNTQPRAVGARVDGRVHDTVSSHWPQECIRGAS